MLPSPSTPLVQDELFRLERFLRSDACGSEAMSISRAHGFMTAAASGPETVTPSEWIRLVFDEPVFEDTRQAEDLLGLVMRLYNDIANSLPDKGLYQPLLEIVSGDDGEPTLSADEWCRGYMEGISLAGDMWAGCSGQELGALLAPILIIVSPAGDHEQSLYAERYDLLCAMLPEAAEDIYRFWLPYRADTD